MLCSIPHGAVSWSAVCYGCISWSYTLILYVYMKHKGTPLILTGIKYLFLIKKKKKKNKCVSCADPENFARWREGVLKLFLVIDVFHRGPYGPPSRGKRTQGVQLLIERVPYQYF